MPKEDVSKIPDVDLSGIDLTQPEEEKDLAQFKSEQDLLKGYKEIQNAFTRVSQENKELKKSGGDPDRIAEMQREMQSLRDEAEMLRLQSQTQNVPSANKSFDESWMESPELAIDQRVAKQVAIARINDVLDEENVKNPLEYAQRYKEADALATQYPALAKTPQGVKKLFKMADEMREKHLKETSKKSLEYLLGENPTEEQLANFKELITGNKKTTKKSNNDAYMPDGSTSTKSGADADTDKGSSGKISEAVNKGDVDGVLQEMFKSISA